jgi:hypothetical protein
VITLALGGYDGAVGGLQRQWREVEAVDGDGQCITRQGQLVWIGEGHAAAHECCLSR